MGQDNSGGNDFFGKVSNAVNTSLNNVVGEIAGSNAERQQKWQKQVADNAAAAQKQSVADQNSANQNADMTASNQTGAVRASAIINHANGGTSFYHYRAPGAADEQNFLGL